MITTHNKNTRGFTLIEVLVALAILAITLSALLKASGSYARNASYLKEKTLAQWIAQNKAAEYQLQKAFPRTGNREGDVNFALQEWRWRVKVSNTDDNRLRRMDIDIILDGGDFKNPIASLVAFVGQPL